MIFPEMLDLVFRNGLQNHPLSQAGGIQKQLITIQNPISVFISSLLVGCDDMEEWATGMTCVLISCAFDESAQRC